MGSFGAQNASHRHKSTASSQFRTDSTAKADYFCKDPLMPNPNMEDVQFHCSTRFRSVDWKSVVELVVVELPIFFLKLVYFSATFGFTFFFN